MIVVVIFVVCILYALVIVIAIVLWFLLPLSLSARRRATGLLPHDHYHYYSGKVTAATMFQSWLSTTWSGGRDHLGQPVPLDEVRAHQHHRGQGAQLRLQPRAVHGGHPPCLWHTKGEAGNIRTFQKYIIIALQHLASVPEVPVRVFHAVVDQVGGFMENFGDRIFNVGPRALKLFLKSIFFEAAHYSTFHAWWHSGLSDRANEAACEGA